MQIICLMHYFCSFHSVSLSLLISPTINLHSYNEREREREHGMSELTSKASSSLMSAVYPFSSQMFSPLTSLVHIAKSRHSSRCSFRENIFCGQRNETSEHLPRQAIAIYFFSSPRPLAHRCNICESEPSPFIQGESK